MILISAVSLPARTRPVKGGRGEAGVGDDGPRLLPPRTIL